MCIISFHYKQHPTYKLIVAANRDEFYERPTKKMHYWEDHPDLLAGRDLEAGGTWLGISKTGRFAALTNYRSPEQMNNDRRTRGDITTNFLISSLHPVEYLEELRKRKDEYNGFNILLSDGEELYYYSNMQDVITKVKQGTHSLSNHLLNTPWPKVNRAKQMLGDYVSDHKIIEPEPLFTQLHDDQLADDDQLPSTGIDKDMEKQLSSIFIRTDGYGTRSSTVLFITHDNDVKVFEQTFNDGTLKAEQKFHFNYA